jgi:hypothetical protein
LRQINDASAGPWQEQDAMADTLSNARTLLRIKLIHTFFWALFATSIVAIPIATALGRYDIGLWLTLLVSIEVVTLLINGMRCPLTGIAARYADDRPVGFDIFLPHWLARYNKLIFGTLLVAAEIYLLASWLSS